MKWMISIVATVVVVLGAGMASAQDAYRISRGDTLAVEVLEDPSLNRTVVVLPDGRISFPFAGTVPAAGRTVGQVESAITTAIASNFANEPNVFVTVAQLNEPVLGGSRSATRTISVFLLGEVKNPGPQEMPYGTTFLQALSAGGGLTPFAADRRVQLRRTDPRSGASSLTEINYRALQSGARLSRSIPLADGDVILVPERRLFELQ